MKRMLKFTIVLVLLFVWTAQGTFAIKAFQSEVDTEPISQEEERQFRRNWQVKVIREEPEKMPIDCFAVSENERIAVGSENSEEKTVCIYTPEGVFQYGYKFKSSGTFFLAWDGNNILVYLVRSDYIVSLDSDGQIVTLCKFSDTSENRKYYREVFCSNQYTVNDKVYKLTSQKKLLSIFTDSYDLITVVDAQGDSTVVYEATNTLLAKALVFCVFAAIFIGVCICVLIYRIKEMKAHTRKDMNIQNVN